MFLLNFLIFKQISKKEMYALTNKNYYNLEENKQRREETQKHERKKEELKARKEKVKELDDVLNIFFSYFEISLIFYFRR